jgi:hypothetical protein
MWHGIVPIALHRNQQLFASMFCWKAPWTASSVGYSESFRHARTYWCLFLWLVLARQSCALIVKGAPHQSFFSQLKPRTWPSGSKLSGLSINYMFQLSRTRVGRKEYLEGFDQVQGHAVDWMAVGESSTWFTNPSILAFEKAPRPYQPTALCKGLFGHVFGTTYQWSRRNSCLVLIRKILCSICVSLLEIKRLHLIYYLLLEWKHGPYFGYPILAASYTCYRCGFLFSTETNNH